MALYNRKALKAFRRQHNVGRFILDFYCPEEKIATELDGAGHDDILRMDYDHERTQYLEAQGIRVIRIENRLLFASTNDVLEYIASFFEQR